MKQFCHFLLSFSILLLHLSGAHSQVWEQLPDFPGQERDDGVSFVINNYAYCGTGIIPGWTTTGDFYRFNLTDQSWSSSASLPSGKERQYACACEHSSKGYLFGGYDGTFLNSLFQYDPVSNQWTELNSLPDFGRSGSSCFVLEDTLYIIGGRSDTELALDEVWAFNLNQQTWSQKNNLPFGKRWKASGISHNNAGYVGFGRDENGQMHSDFYQYEAVTDNWIPLNDLPGNERCYAQLSIFEDELIALFGLGTGNTYLNDVWKYNAATDSWTALSSFPDEPRKGGVVFSSQHSVYYVTGITSENDRLKEVWRIMFNDLSVKEVNTVKSIYPNPVSDFLHIPKCDGKITLIDSGGKVILETVNQSTFNTSELLNGFYIIMCESGWTDKVLIRHN